MSVMYYVYSWGVARLTKDLSGVIQGSDDGGLYWFSGQGEGREIDRCESCSGGISCLFLSGK